MCERYVYEHNNLPPNTIEKYFQKIEDEIAPAIKNVISDIDRHKNQEIDFHTIKSSINQYLPTFIVFYYRSNALLTEFSSGFAEAKIPLMSEKILNQGYVNLLAETIKNFYKFAIIESDNNFLMSDQYVSTAALKAKARFVDVSNRHIGVKETIIMIPLSAKYYAVYWHSDGSFILNDNSLNILDKEITNDFNQTIIDNSYLKCIGAREDILREAIANYTWASPSQIYLGHSSGGSSGFTNKKEVFFYKDDAEAYKMFCEAHKIKEYTQAGRNDLCPCDSGKKFKKCHEHIIEKLKTILNNHSNKAFYQYIPNVPIVEKPIDAWGNLAK